MASLILLNLIASVCLLLWGLRYLKNGMMKGFGRQVRKILQIGTKHPISAVFTGIIMTLFLQSSTASILLTGSFVSQGLITLPAAIGLALGADVGTAIVAWLLSFDLKPVLPVLMILGFTLYVIQSSPLTQNLGRIFIGLALMLLALSWIRETAAPLKDSELFETALGVLKEDSIFILGLIALMTWLFHSSLAMILLGVTLAGAEVISPTLGLYLVLGANLGGAMPAVIASWHDIKASQLALANLILRFSAMALCYPFLPLIDALLQEIARSSAGNIVLFHVLFNVALCIVALPFTGLLASLLNTLRADQPNTEDPGQARYLEKDLLDSPPIALANSARETLRMAEMVQHMLGETIAAFETNDRRLIDEIRAEDNVVDRLYGSIKSYLARLLAQEQLSEKEASRAVHILTFATNLEHIGDVIDKNLMPMAKKKTTAQMEFSGAGLEEIREFHTLILDSIILAQQVFLSGDTTLAQKMLDQKRTEIRRAEERATERHIKRLRDGVPETMTTSALHLDIIRDFRRINTYACSVAYDVLKEAGEVKRDI